MRKKKNFFNKVGKVKRQFGGGEDDDAWETFDWPFGRLPSQKPTVESMIDFENVYTTQSILEEVEKVLNEAEREERLKLATKITTEASAIRKLENALNRLEEFEKDTFDENEIKKQPQEDHILQEVGKMVTRIQANNDEKENLEDENATQSFEEWEESEIFKILHSTEELSMNTTEGDRKYPNKEAELEQSTSKAEEGDTKSIDKLYSGKNKLSKVTKAYSDSKKHTTENKHRIIETTTSKNAEFSAYEKEESLPTEAADMFFGEFKQTTACVGCEKTESESETSKAKTKIIETEKIPKENNNDVLMLSNQHETSTICELCSKDSENHATLSKTNPKKNPEKTTTHEFSKSKNHTFYNHHVVVSGKNIKEKHLHTHKLFKKPQAEVKTKQFLIHQQEEIRYLDKEINEARQIMKAATENITVESLIKELPLIEEEVEKVLEKPKTTLSVAFVTNPVEIIKNLKIKTNEANTLPSKKIKLKNGKETVETYSSYQQEKIISSNFDSVTKPVDLKTTKQKEIFRSKNKTETEKFDEKVFGKERNFSNKTIRFHSIKHINFSKAVEVPKKSSESGTMTFLGEKKILTTTESDIILSDKEDTSKTVNEDAEEKENFTESDEAVITTMTIAEKEEPKFSNDEENSYIEKIFEPETQAKGVSTGKKSSEENELFESDKAASTTSILEKAQKQMLTITESEYLGTEDKQMSNKDRDSTKEETYELGTQAVDEAAEEKTEEREESTESKQVVGTTSLLEKSIEETMTLTEFDNVETEEQRFSIEEGSPNTEETSRPESQAEEPETGEKFAEEDESSKSEKAGTTSTLEKVKLTNAELEEKQVSTKETDENEGNFKEEESTKSEVVTAVASLKTEEETMSISESDDFSAKERTISNEESANRGIESQTFFSESGSSYLEEVSEFETQAEEVTVAEKTAEGNESSEGEEAGTTSILEKAEKEMLTTPNFGILGREEGQVSTKEAGSWEGEGISDEEEESIENEEITAATSQQTEKEMMSIAVSDNFGTEEQTFSSEEESSNLEEVSELKTQAEEVTVRENTAEENESSEGEEAGTTSILEKAEKEMLTTSNFGILGREEGQVSTEEASSHEVEGNSDEEEESTENEEIAAATSQQTEKEMMSIAVSDNFGTEEQTFSSEEESSNLEEVSELKTQAEEVTSEGKTAEVYESSESKGAGTKSILEKAEKEMLTTPDSEILGTEERQVSTEEAGSREGEGISDEEEESTENEEIAVATSQQTEKEMMSIAVSDNFGTEEQTFSSEKESSNLEEVSELKTQAEQVTAGEKTAEVYESFESEESGTTSILEKAEKEMLTTPRSEILGTEEKQVSTEKAGLHEDERNFEEGEESTENDEVVAITSLKTEEETMSKSESATIGKEEQTFFNEEESSYTEETSELESRAEEGVTEEKTVGQNKSFESEEAGTTSILEKAEKEMLTNAEFENFDAKDNQTSTEKANSHEEEISEFETQEVDEEAERESEEVKKSTVSEFAGITSLLENTEKETLTMTESNDNGIEEEKFSHEGESSYTEETSKFESPLNEMAFGEKTTEENKSFESEEAENTSISEKEEKEMISTTGFKNVGTEEQQMSSEEATSEFEPQVLDETTEEKLEELEKSTESEEVASVTSQQTEEETMTVAESNNFGTEKQTFFSEEESSYFEQVSELKTQAEEVTVGENTEEEKESSESEQVGTTSILEKAEKEMFTTPIYEILYTEEEKVSTEEAGLHEDEENSDEEEESTESEEVAATISQQTEKETMTIAETANLDTEEQTFFSEEESSYFEQVSELKTRAEEMTVGENTEEENESSEVEEAYTTSILEKTEKEMLTTTNYQILDTEEKQVSTEKAGLHEDETNFEKGEESTESDEVVFITSLETEEETISKSESANLGTEEQTFSSEEESSNLEEVSELKTQAEEVTTGEKTAEVYESSESEEAGTTSILEKAEKEMLTTRNFGILGRGEGQVSIEEAGSHEDEGNSDEEEESAENKDVAATISQKTEKETKTIAETANLGTEEQTFSSEEESSHLEEVPELETQAEEVTVGEKTAEENESSEGEEAGTTSMLEKEEKEMLTSLKSEILGTEAELVSTKEADLHKNQKNLDEEEKSTESEEVAAASFQHTEKETMSIAESAKVSTEKQTFSSEGERSSLEEVSEPKTQVEEVTAGENTAEDNESSESEKEGNSEEGEEYTGSEGVGSISFPRAEEEMISKAESTTIGKEEHLLSSEEESFYIEETSEFETQPEVTAGKKIEVETEFFESQESGSTTSVLEKAKQEVLTSMGSENLGTEKQQVTTGEVGSQKDEESSQEEEKYSESQEIVTTIFLETEKETMSIAESYNLSTKEETFSSEDGSSYTEENLELQTQTEVTAEVNESFESEETFITSNGNETAKIKSEEGTESTESGEVASITSLKIENETMTKAESNNLEAKEHKVSSKEAAGTTSILKKTEKEMLTTPESENFVAEEKGEESTERKDTSLLEKTKTKSNDFITKGQTFSSEEETLYTKETSKLQNQAETMSAEEKTGTTSLLKKTETEHLGTEENQASTGKTVSHEEETSGLKIETTAKHGYFSTEEPNIPSSVSIKKNTEGRIQKTEITESPQKEEFTVIQLNVRTTERASTEPTNAIKAIPLEKIVTESESRTSTARPNIQKLTTNNDEELIVKLTQKFDEYDMEHFSQKEEHTICEICTGLDKSDVSTELQQNTVLREETVKQTTILDSFSHLTKEESEGQNKFSVSRLEEITTIEAESKPTTEFETTSYKLTETKTRTEIKSLNISENISTTEAKELKTLSEEKFSTETTMEVNSEFPNEERFSESINGTEVPQVFENQTLIAQQWEGVETTMNSNETIFTTIEETNVTKINITEIVNEETKAISKTENSNFFEKFNKTNKYLLTLTEPETTFSTQKKELNGTNEQLLNTNFETESNISELEENGSTQSQMEETYVFQKEESNFTGESSFVKEATEEISSSKSQSEEIATSQKEESDLIEENSEKQQVTEILTEESSFVEEATEEISSSQSQSEEIATSQKEESDLIEENSEKQHVTEILTEESSFVEKATEEISSSQSQSEEITTSQKEESDLIEENSEKQHVTVILTKESSFVEEATEEISSSQSQSEEVVTSQKEESNLIEENTEKNYAIKILAEGSTAVSETSNTEYEDAERNPNFDVSKTEKIGTIYIEEITTKTEEKTIVVVHTELSTENTVDSELLSELVALENITSAEKYEIEEVTTNPKKETVTNEFSQKFEDNEMEHFSQKENNTICESCSTMATDLEFSKTHSTTLSITESEETKPTPKQEVTSFEVEKSTSSLIILSEAFEDDNMEHFPQEEQNTVCELCINETTTQLVSGNNETLGTNTKTTENITAASIITNEMISLTTIESEIKEVNTEPNQIIANTEEFKMLEQITEFSEKSEKNKDYFSSSSIESELQQENETVAEETLPPEENVTALQENFQDLEITVTEENEITETEKYENFQDENEKISVAQAELEELEQITEIADNHTATSSITSEQKELDVNITEEPSRMKGTTFSSAFNFSTTFMLLLTSVYGNKTTTNGVKHNHITSPSIYVDLPVFLPNMSIPFEVEKTTPQNNFVKIVNSNATEMLLLFLKGTNDEALKKLNGSKWIRRLDHGEMVYEAKTETTPHEMIPMSKLHLPKYISLDECKKDDFEKHNKCFCAVDSLLTTLKEGEVASNTSTHLTCLNFLKVNDGVMIGNESTAHIRKKRSYLYGKYDGEFKREIVDYNRGFFNDDFKIRNTESRIYTLPGTKVKLPCLSREDAIEYNRYMQYSWTFEDDIPITENQVQENEGNLLLDDVMPKDSGNYTCTVKSRINEKNNVVQKYFHRLVVVSTPIYKIVTTVIYNLKEPCELSDGDVISMYLPNILSGLLCGYREKMCKVDVRRPFCVNKEEEKLLNVTFTVTMFSLKEMIPTIDINRCDLNCQIVLYSKLAAILLKNIETFCKLPVFSKVSLKEQDFSPKKVAQFRNKEKGRWSLPPVLIVTCPGGFGVEKKQPRLCVVCPKNTYNPGSESYCKMCPAGQYQPVAGSKSCIVCSSPLENRACLRVLYSNTRYFKIYVGVAFALVLTIIVVICYCTRNSTAESLTHGRRHDYVYSMLRKDADLEKGINEPLLRKDRNRVPPQLPPPDF